MSDTGPSTRLAEAASVSRATLGSIERAEHVAHLVTYRRLAAALQLPMSELADDQQPEEPNQRLRLVGDEDRVR